MNDIYIGQLVSSDYLEHHGILGMKWGVRRFQREDGSLTPAGKKRKSSNNREFKENRHDRAARASQRDADDLRKHGYTKEADAVQKVADKQREKANAKREKAVARKQEKELKKKELAANIHNKAHEYDRKKNWHEAYNKAADEFNTRINGINAKYTGKNLGKNFETKDGQKYVTEVGKMWKEVYSKAAVDRFGTTLSVSSDGTVKEGRDFVNNMPFMNQYDEFIKR